jgi:CHRD domain-containing protein
MKACLKISMAVFAALFVLAQPAIAADNVAARLTGLDEVPSISTTGQGFFLGTVNVVGSAIDYSLVYFDLRGAVREAHIHIGQPGVNGGIVMYLCSNLTPAPAGVPVPPPCPSGAALNNVGGTLSAANVVAVTGQGFPAGDFTRVLRAMRAGKSYVNVHTDLFTSGEIRGQVTE